MSGIFIGAITLTVLVACTMVWVIRGQNRLVFAEELCGNALSQIGVQQASRWDALNALTDLTRGFSQQEYKTIMDAISARQYVGPKTTAADAQRQEDLLASSFGRIHALAEAYPELKSNTVYLSTMESIHDYEDKVRLSRMVYNDTVTKYIRLVRSLPGSLVAGGLGFAVRDYLQDDPGKATMPDMALQGEGVNQ